MWIFSTNVIQFKWFIVFLCIFSPNTSSLWDLLFVDVHHWSHLPLNIRDPCLINSITCFSTKDDYNDHHLFCTMNAFILKHLNKTQFSFYTLSSAFPPWKTIHVGSFDCFALLFNYTIFHQIHFEPNIFWDPNFFKFTIFFPKGGHGHSLNLPRLQSKFNLPRFIYIHHHLCSSIWWFFVLFERGKLPLSTNYINWILRFPLNPLH